MFPNMPSVTFGDQYHDAQLAKQRETRPLNRLEHQRQFLKDKQMYYLDTMSVDQRASDRDRDLVQRQMIAEARGITQSPVTKFRQSVGGALIAIGERIRPSFAQNEPTYNA